MQDSYFLVDIDIEKKILGSNNISLGEKSKVKKVLYWLLV